MRRAPVKAMEEEISARNLVRSTLGSSRNRDEAALTLFASSGLMQCNKEHAYWIALEASTILGRQMVKVDPRPGSLSTVISPPII